MKSTYSYFNGSVMFAFAATAFAATVGFLQGGFELMIAYTISVLLLGVLETSVSLDNAVVNAKYLETMNEKSKHWFLTWGMVIAVFGMRLILPILIVCIAAWTDPYSALKMALFDPKQYQHNIESVHIEIMGFGASFLLLVALDYFFDHEKETHWIPGIEKVAAFIGKFPQINLLIAMPLIIAAGVMAPKEGQQLMFAGFGGMLVFYAVHGVKELLEKMEEEGLANSIVGQSTKLMIGSLVFLEILDASFSFDGVISAFAITNNFMIMAAGLGIGAMFVRSLTIYLVDKKTMSELKYLENAALWGIVWLIAAMVTSAYGLELGEVVVAGVAGLIIAVGAVHSLLIKKS